MVTLAGSTLAAQCPCTACLPSATAEQSQAVFFPPRPQRRKVPSPAPQPGYLLSQKKRAWASRTSSTAMLSTSAGVSAQCPRRPWTELRKASVPSSSRCVRLCRFSDCSPELCAGKGTGHFPSSSQSHPQPRGWLTHEGPELLHAVQDELLVAQRPHGQSLEAAGAQLEQVVARQLPVLEGVVLQTVIEACGGGGEKAQDLSGPLFTPETPFSLQSDSNGIGSPMLCSAHFTDGATELRTVALKGWSPGAAAAASPGCLLQPQILRPPHSCQVRLRWGPAGCDCTNPAGDFSAA